MRKTGMNQNGSNRKRIRRAVPILLAAFLMCGLTACGAGRSGKEQNSEQNSVFKDDIPYTEEKDSEQNTEEGPLQDSGQDSVENAPEGVGQNSGEDTPEDSEQTEEESEEPTAPPEFSTTDWKTLEFALNGHVFTFPLNWSDIEAAGYKFKDEYREEVLEAGYYTTSLSATSDERERISVQFKNFGEEDQTLVNCYVYGITLDVYDNPTAILCNGVTIGMTLDDVKALMGEPDDYYTSATEEDPTPENLYETASYYVEGTLQKSLIKFTFRSGALARMNLVNTD